VTNDDYSDEDIRIDYMDEQMRKSKEASHVMPIEVIPGQVQWLWNYIQELSQMLADERLKCASLETQLSKAFAELAKMQTRQP